MIKNYFKLIVALVFASNVMAQKMSAGHENTFVVCDNGSLYGWGSNTSGQIGDGTNTLSNSPKLISLIADVKMVVSGQLNFTLVLKNDGTVWSFGNNSNGQLGLGNLTNYNKPTQIQGLTNIVSISAGNISSFALKSDGTVYAWGGNNKGQLGIGNNTDKNIPTIISNLSNIKSISAGDFHTLFLKNDGTVWSCGIGTVGELGNGTNLNSNVPVQVMNLSNIIKIKAGFSHSIVLKNDGTVSTWGYNNSGQLGNGNLNNSNIPINIANINNVIDIKTGDGHCIVLKSDSTVWSWGFGNWGVLGNNSNSNSLTPVQVQNLNKIIDVFGGSYHTIAKKVDGTYWTWGRNDVSQLGDGTTINKLIPVQINLTCPSINLFLSSTKVFVDAPATVNQNQEVELSISTEALNTADNVIAYQTDFSYDTTRYTYVGNNLTGTLNPSGNAVVNSTKNGKLAISYMSQTALNGAGSLVKLKFKANNTLGQGIFGLSNFLYNTTTVSSLKSDTVNTIDGIPPTAKITYSQNPVRKGDSLLITVNFNEKIAVSPVPQLNLTGQNTLANTNLTKVNDTTYTYWWVVEKGNGDVNVALATGQDLGGNVIVATPTQNPSFTVLPTLFGDIDTNKLVQAYDAALALQYSVGLNPLPTMDPLPWSNWRLAVANVDTVGNVSANDASLILQHSAKLISTFPADAKKRGGDAPVANVSVTQEGNQLVFRATGTLYAFNVFMKDNFNVLGQPDVKNKSAMLATNINTTTYNVGLASTTPFVENEPFLVIPILTNENVQGTMDIVANSQERSLIYGKAAGIGSINKEAVIVYPNPTKDIVTINNAEGKTLRIVDVQGKEVFNQKVNASSMEVSMKAIATRGEYIFQLINENNSIESTQKIILE